jgi:hypothetical protein
MKSSRSLQACFPKLKRQRVPGPWVQQRRQGLSPSLVPHRLNRSRRPFGLYAIANRDFQIGGSACDLGVRRVEFRGGPIFANRSPKLPLRFEGSPPGDMRPRRAKRCSFECYPVFGSVRVVRCRTLIVGNCGVPVTGSLASAPVPEGARAA